MAKFNAAFNSFVAGEISPKARSRVDLQQYSQSCEELYNQLVHVQGGSYRRPGSIFDGITGTGAFQQTVWEEFQAASYLRIFPYFRSDGTRYLVVFRACEVDTGVVLAGVIDIAAQKFWYFSTAASLFVSYEYQRTFTEAQLRAASYTQAGDILVIQVPGHPTFFCGDVKANSTTVTDFTMYTIGSVPATLTKTLNTTCLLSFQLPFFTRNVGGNQGNGTMAASVTSGNGTLTNASSTSGFEFFDEHKGALFKISATSSTGFCEITSISSTTVANMTVIATLPTTGGVGGTGGVTTSWEESAFSDARGWPISVTYHQQRLYYLKADGSVYASRVGNIFDLMQRRFEQDAAFSSTVVASDPFSFTIASKEPPIGRWLYGAKNLQLGTIGREFIAKGSTALSAVDIQVDAESALGASTIQPVRIDNALYFVQRAGQSIRQLTYNNDEDAYQAQDLNILADHIVRRSLSVRSVYNVPQFAQVEAQLTETPILWTVDTNGGLLSCTIDRSSQVFAWAYHEMGGALDGEPPKVLSLANIPSNEGRHDELYMVVQRTINGATVNYIEHTVRPFELDDLYNTSTDIDDKPIYLDSAIMVTAGSPTKTITGLDHLEGQTVQVIGDGKYLGEYTVASNAVTITTDQAGYEEFIVGLKYTSRIISNDIEAGATTGVAQGAHKRAARAVIRFNRSIGCKYGIKDGANSNATYTLYELGFRTPDLTTGQSIPLFTGDKLVDLPLGVARNQRVVLQQELPFPMDVSGVFVDGITSA